MRKFSESGINVTVYKETDSTNTRARDFLEQGKKEPFLVFAEQQTAGRGRSGHTFFSPENGFYYTLAVRPKDLNAAIARTTIAAAVSLHDAILETAGISCSIKWVNDLYLDQRKVAGILCEAPVIHGKTGSILIGIGVNINRHDFPDELKDIAGSIDYPDLDRALLAVRLTEHILRHMEHLDDPDLTRAYKEHSLLLGKTVTFMQDGEVCEGTAEDITDEGNLVVRGEKSWILNSGEVSLRSW